MVGRLSLHLGCEIRVQNGVGLHVQLLLQLILTRLDCQSQSYDSVTQTAPKVSLV